MDERRRTGAGLSASDKAARARAEILRHLEKYGTENKDARAEKRGGASPIKRRKKSLRFTLDLHGERTEGALRRLRGAIERCRRDGISELLVIHGQGHHSHPMEGPVVKNAVRKALASEFHYLIRDYMPASPRDGGGGATLIKIF